MPDRKVQVDVSDVLARARRLAGGEHASRGVVVIRPDHSSLLLPSPTDSPEVFANAQAMRRIIPAEVQRAIAVIADTSFPLGNASSLSMLDVAKAIPFLGMLVGLSYIGHQVWVFDGDVAAIPAGCRNADLLLVDSGVLPRLAKGWEQMAAGVMRNVNILEHDRQTFRLRVIRKVGESQDRIEFAN